MALESSDCCFCAGLVQAKSDVPWNTVLHDTGRFIITPTKGALVPGWLLVVAKSHVLCAGALDASQQGELREALAIARGMVERNFGPPTVFEHGPCLPGTPLGCGIDHLHLHVTPLAFSLREAVDSLFPSVEWQPLDSFSSARALFNARWAYGIVQEPNDQMYWFSPPAGVRQFLRRAVASALGVPEQFDYAQFPNLPNVLETLKSLGASRYA